MWAPGGLSAVFLRGNFLRVSSGRWPVGLLGDLFVVVSLDFGDLVWRHVVGGRPQELLVKVVYVCNRSCSANVGLQAVHPWLYLLGGRVVRGTDRKAIRKFRCVWVHYWSEVVGCYQGVLLQNVESLFNLLLQDVIFGEPA